MSPQLVEYSEDDDTGCGIGIIVLGAVGFASILVMRLVMHRRPAGR